MLHRMFAPSKSPQNYPSLRFWISLRFIGTIGAIGILTLAGLARGKEAPRLPVRTAPIVKLERYDPPPALENLRAIEASNMVYDTYENFIVPRICIDENRTADGKKSTCRLKGKVSPKLFLRDPYDPTGILYTINNQSQKLLQNLNPGFTGEGDMLIPAAPKHYAVTYVGCFRRDPHSNSDCSLFFTISESEEPGLPPIFAVKGTSSSEDWRNNVTAGSGAIRQISEVFNSLRLSVLGGSAEKLPAKMHDLAQQLGEFFRGLANKAGSIIFSGHSLGGALAQELGREIFLLTRTNFATRAGPKVRVITFNGLSYTSMLSKLSNILSDPHSASYAAAATRYDYSAAGRFRDIFRGPNLSAINFHTVDDILTQGFNYSFLGKAYRITAHTRSVQAGDDAVIPTNRAIQLGSLGAMMAAHSSLIVSRDMLYAAGLVRDPSSEKKFKGVSRSAQLEYFKTREDEFRKAVTMEKTPEAFRLADRNPDVWEKNGGTNVDRIIMYPETGADGDPNEDTRVKMYRVWFPRAVTTHAFRFGYFDPNVSWATELTENLY